MPSAPVSEATKRTRTCAVAATKSVTRNWCLIQPPPVPGPSGPTVSTVTQGPPGPPETCTTNVSSWEPPPPLLYQRQ